jgi:hypothetical protein
MGGQIAHEPARRARRKGIIRILVRIERNGKRRPPIIAASVAADTVPE